jgi:hypothetical protein
MKTSNLTYLRKSHFVNLYGHGIFASKIIVLFDDNNLLKKKNYLSIYHI